MWTRPDTGSAIVSGPAPSWSAAKGIFEAVARLKTAYIRPARCEICSPVVYHRYLTNYSGPLRKADQIRKRAPFQLPAVVLADVCYRLYGEVEEMCPAPGRTNHLHALQEMFQRRLVKGQLFRMVCLGWSEFVPTYFGPVRELPPVQDDFSTIIPSMLHSVFDRPVAGRVAPQFRQNVEIRKGVLEYAR